MAIVSYKNGSKYYQMMFHRAMARNENAQIVLRVLY